MDVYGAVDSRRAVRAFSDEPVPKETLERVLAAASRAPSSGNLQPWHVYVVTGEPLAELKRRATARARAGDPGDDREYPMYPADLASPYLDRFSAAAAQRYAALGIERDDPDRPVKIYRKTVGQTIGADDRIVLFCGVSVGFEKEGVPPLRTGRADMTETVRFIGV
ncbi:nitroreductase family protein [Streptomyces iakyrus]|uniref:nitroreductase family protein n=1 Tax=Streptomyces iakyrus TaxID=68219 RepID=UPI0033BF192C